MPEDELFFHTRIDDGNVPLLVFDNSLFFPKEEFEVSYGFKTLDRIAPGREAWREYFKPKGIIICTCKTTVKGPRVLTLPANWKSDAFKVGTAAQITGVEVVGKEKVIIRAKGLGKAEIWELADPAKLAVISDVPIVRRFGVFDSQLKNREDMAATLKPFKALLERFMKLDTMSNPKRSEVLSKLHDAPDLFEELITDPKGLTQILQSIMYLVGEEFIRSSVTAQELQTMVGEPCLEQEVEAFCKLLHKSIITYLNKKDPGPGKGKSKSTTGGDPTGEGGTSDENLRAKFERSKESMNPEARQEIGKELERLESSKGQMAATADLAVSRKWLEYSLALPWGTSTKDRTDFKEAERILDTSHYGMAKVKNVILEILATMMENPDYPMETVLCFVGPPGVGKTSLGRAIASTLDRKFIRESLGGVRDEADIRGHRRTYIGAFPGKIMEAVRRGGSLNPVFMLDEIDKVGRDYKGDPDAALMEVFDPEQNHDFRDHYYGYPFDISQTLFICTANMLESISEPLQDRMEIIKLPGYYEHEKLHIAQEHLIKRQLEKTGLASKTDVRFTDAALREIINAYTFEAGVRNLERFIRSILRKINRERQSGNVRNEIVIDVPDVRTHLGKPLRKLKVIGPTLVGEANGLSVTTTSTGVSMGDVLAFQTLLVPGERRKEFSHTGHMGVDMIESAHDVLSVLRDILNTAHVMDPGETIGRLEKQMVHVKASNGGQPKDGPSAGITMLCALLSSVLNEPLKPYLAMTGEMNLTKRVSAVGGITDKLLAAERAGIKEVIIPKDNADDLDDFPKEVREKIHVHLVEDVFQAVSIAFKGSENPVIRALSEKAAK